jgi:DNA-directed RNA polymerase subunit RPC12/RpoP
MVAVNKDVVYDNPDRCVKDDKTAVGPCMCVACIADATTTSSNYVPKGVVLTDDNLVPGGAQQRIAYHFVCAGCGKGNTADYMSYCPDCGTRVIIRSHVVLDFLKQHQMKTKI